MSAGNDRLRILTIASALWLAGALSGGSAAWAGAIAPFGLKDLQAILSRDPAPASVESLLPLLPEALRFNSTFIHRSRSLQGSTPTEPRALAWSETGRFVFGVNGNPAYRGYDVVELFEESQEDRRFHFYQIVFAPKPHLEEPKVCLTCHGERPRPIWGEYPVWTGTEAAVTQAYGALDDVIDGTENPPYSAFASLAPRDPRYRWFFPATPDLRPEYPYRNQARVVPDDPRDSFAYRPNLRLNLVLNRWNADRLGAELERTYPSAPVLARFTASLMACDGAAPLSEALAGAGLEPRDLDIRYLYKSPLNAGLDPMKSYFDGSATVRELLAARLIEALSRRGANLDTGYFERTLGEKYRNNTGSAELDRPIMDAVDSLGGWVPLPYAVTPETRAQKREPYLAAFKRRYVELCLSMMQQPALSPRGPTPPNP